MALHPVASLLAGLAIVSLITTGVLVIWWYITKQWLRPLMMADKYVDMMVEREMNNFFLLTTRSLLSLPSLFINAFFTMVSVITEKPSYIMCIIILSSASLIWIDTHDSVLESYMVLRQCYTQEIINFFLLPIIDIVVMLYNAVIGVFNLVINLRAFATYGAPIVLFKCALHQELGNLLFYIADTFYVFMFEFNQWIANGPTSGEWNVLLTLRSIGFVVDCLLPIMNCFCASLSSLWEGINLFANELSVHYFVNCLLNTVIRLFQILIVTIKFFVAYILPGINPVKPDFTNATNAACCTLYNGGDAIEDGIYLIVELIWGLIGQDLPPVLRQFLSIHYASILSHPLCGVVKVINMTAVLFVNLNDDPNGFLEPTGTGIQYLQFGFVADEFKYGALKLGEPFYIFNPAAQGFVSQLALSVVDIAAFILEWVIGNVWFFIWAKPSDVLPHYPVPLLTGIYRYLDFLFYYFPNYWIKAPPGGTPITTGTYTYSSALSQLYNDTFLMSVAAGDLVGLLNNPLGCVVEHLLKSIITFAAVLANIISFFMPIFTFDDDPATTARAVEVDIFFLELTYTSDCLGTLVSQFGNCTPTENDAQDNLFCCTGEVITSGLDAVISLVQQVVHFFLDVLTLPTSAIELCLFGAYNPNKEECMRIPNLADPIAKLDAALCAFACAVANIIPVTFLFNGFNCIFPPGDPVDDNSESGSNIGGDIASLFNDFGDIFGTGNTLAVNVCHSVTSCIGNVLCSILQIFTIPFTILNQFFIQMIAGNPITNLFEFLNTSATLLAKGIGRAGDSLGILVDCAFCAFFNDGVDCGTTFYTLMHYVFVVPFVALAGSFGLVSFYLGRIVMSGIKDMFNGAGYLGSYSIITKAAKLFGIYGEAANFWFTRIFSSMGLYMVGSTFSATNRGVCEIVEATLAEIAVIISTLSGGLLTVPTVIMCCYGSFACWPIKKRDMDDVNDEPRVMLHGNGSTTVTLTPNTWLRFVVNNFSQALNWSDSDTCHSAMNIYKNKPWDSLTIDEVDHVYFCIYKVIWRIRTDGQSMAGMPNSTCDDAMIGLVDTDWSSLRFMEKSIISNCILSRRYIDDMRQKANIPWFPQDWWTNEYRKMHFGTELLMAIRIYYQYMMDHSTAPSIMTSVPYKEAWSTMGLNTSHYEGLVTTDDVLIMRTHYHLQDYYEWNNNATQFKPIVWLTTGIWSFIETLSGRVAGTSSAFSDNVTDPTVYLAYTYHTDVPGGVSDGLFFSIISSIASAVNKFASQWANPQNLKKRAGLFSTTKKMTGKIVETASKEATRMSLEWWKAASHNISIYYGEGEANETIAFMNEYETAVKGLDESHGNHSIIYKLGHWWHNFQLPSVKRVPVQKDGKYRGSTDTGESTMERLSGYITTMRKGTEGSNSRVERLTSGFYMMRNRFYTKIIQQRIDEIRERHRTQSKIETSYSVNQAHDGVTTYRVKTRPHDMVDALNNETKPLFDKLKEIEAYEAKIHKKTGLLPERSMLLNRIYTNNALIRMNSLLDLTCTSSSALLCSDCFFVDQLVGRVENGVRITVGYYEGGQYGAAINETMDNFAYAFDENAPVRIGDSDELPIRWPWRYFSNWRILGDRTPNKIRFDDVFNLTEGITENFGLAIENSTLYNEIDYSSANGIVSAFIFQFFLPIVNFFYQLVIFLFSPTGVTDATASVSFLLQNWVVCDWNVGSAFLGTHKRFSIGEMLFGYGVIYVAVMFIGTTALGVNIWSVLGSTGFAGMIFGFTFLSVTYNWAWLCWPGLPVQLFMDINYFLIHTLFTKCDWFFSGLVKGPYTNTNCYPCSFAMTIEMTNCKELGPVDLFSNLIFYIEYWAPGTIQWIRDTTSPIYIFYQIPFINQRLNQFANVNMNDPDIFALYWTCETSITVPPNLILAALFYFIVKFLRPLLDIIFGLVIIVLQQLVSVTFLNFYIMQSFFFMDKLYPHFMTGYTERHIDGSDDNDDNSTIASREGLSPYGDRMMMMGSSYPMEKPQAMRSVRRRNVAVPEYNPQRNRQTFSSILNSLAITRRRYFGNEHID